MDKTEFIKNNLLESASVKKEIFGKCSESIQDAVEMITEGYKSNNKVLLCGNGGSAADCQHIAAELMIRLNHDINRPALAAIALTTDSSNLTAGGNDIGFENVFARNVEGLGRAGDILIAISTSGNSENVIRAVEKAKTLNLKIIGFLGGTGGKLADKVDCSIIIPSTSTQRIQEGHITIAHIICELVELELYPL